MTKLRDELRPAEKEAADAKIKAKANAAAAKARAKKEKKQTAETKKRAKEEAKKAKKVARPRPQRRLCMPTHGGRIWTPRRAPRPDEKNGRAPCVMGPKGSAVNIKPVAC